MRSLHQREVRSFQAASHKATKNSLLMKKKETVNSCAVVKYLPKTPSLLSAIHFGSEMLPQSKMPRATGNWRRREACGSTVPVGEEKHLFPWQLPHLTAVHSALFGTRENLAFQQIPCHLPSDYQPTVKTPWMLKICSVPKGCLLGAIRRSMRKKKSLLCHLASISKFSWNSGSEHSDKHYFLIFFFFPSPWCFYSTHSQQAAMEAEGVTNGHQEGLRPQKIRSDVIQLTRKEKEKWKQKQNKLRFGPPGSTRYLPIYLPWNLKIPGGNIFIF